MKFIGKSLIGSGLLAVKSFANRAEMRIILADHLRRTFIETSNKELNWLQRRRQRRWRLSDVELIKEAKKQSETTKIWPIVTLQMDPVIDGNSTHLIIGTCRFYWFALWHFIDCRRGDFLQLFIASYLNALSSDFSRRSRRREPGS